MKKLGLIAALIIGMLLPVGCGSSGGGLEQFIQELRGCTNDGLGWLVGLTLIFEPIIDAIEDGDSFPGLEVEELDEVTNLWSFTYIIDIDGDGEPDTTISGTIDFSEDPSDGIAPDATGVIDWDVNGTEDLLGEGVFTLEWGEAGMTSIAGFGELEIPGGCYIEFDIPAETPLNFNPNTTEPVTNIFGGELYGILEMYVDTGSHDIESILTMAMGSDTIQASNVLVDGLGGAGFSFNVDLDEDGLQATFACAFGTFLALDQVLDDLNAAIQAAVLGAEFDGDFEAIPVQNAIPPAWTFTALRDGASMSGTITLGGIPVPNSPISASITFEYDDGDFLASATGGNPLVLRGTLGEAQTISDIVAYGRITTTFEGPVLVQQGDPQTCVSTTTIPSTNPISVEFFDSEGNTPEGAKMFLDVNFDGDNLKLALAAIDDGEDIDFFPVGVLFNNFPIPFSLLDL